VVARRGAQPKHLQAKEQAGRELVHPVEQVSYEDCAVVARRLGLVLPTEAQWEHACRAGTSSPWWTGDERGSLAGAANVADRTWRAEGGRGEFEEWLEDGYVVHAPVGALKPNAFGLHDVHGNVWEWCRDWYCREAHELRPGDGERVVPHGAYRVYRGGSWYISARLARSADRGWREPGDSNASLGFRPASIIGE
jgi:formylglycine-generating enzyme required for sulfatase activity